MISPEHALKDLLSGLHTPIRLTARVTSWPLKVPFVIARSTRTEATVVEVVAEISLGADHHKLVRGRGECQPNSRYGYAAADVAALLDGNIIRPEDADDFWQSLPAPARNGLDCALLDLAAKARHSSVADLLGIPPAQAHDSVTTISLGSASDMAEAAAAAADEGYRALKLKLGAGRSDAGALAAIRIAVGASVQLVADANEGWQVDDLPMLLTAAYQANVLLVEQPLPAGHGINYRQLVADLGLDGMILCADESFAEGAELCELATRYHAINIKLDKVGGLRAALAAADAAHHLGVGYMLGCMLGSSLAMAPAQLLARDAIAIDLDGPFLLASDQDNGLYLQAGKLRAADNCLWG